MNFELPSEAMSALMAQCLKEDLRLIEIDIKRLKEIRDTKGLETYQEIDLANDKKYRKAIRILLTYYSDEYY